MRKTHGDSHSIEHKTWLSIRERCLFKTNRLYPRYGGRGIAICDRWRDSYENFLADMGRRPPDKSSIDRIDNTKGYEPGNCRWSTPAEQANNRRDNIAPVAAFGQVKTLSQWAREVGIGRMAIVRRLKLGWQPERALTTPVDPKRSYRPQRG